jgi:DNA invertase Pin-like site-specific DNA recombinase
MNMNDRGVGLYLRVSTGDETIENQRKALAAAHEARDGASSRNSQ